MANNNKVMKCKLLYILLFFTFHFSLFTLLTSCDKDEATRTYSRKYPVHCFFYVPTYIELFNTMGSYGEFVTIRQRTFDGVSVIEMVNTGGSNHYAIDRTMQYFNYGLAGLIVGVNIYGEHMAFDLGCPNCDRSDRRLTIGDAGIAKCAKCGLSYDLNNYGVISASSGTSLYDSPRGLYRYRIMYDGLNLSIYN